MYRVIVAGKPQAIGAGVTKQVVSDLVTTTSSTSKNLRVDVVASSVTAAAGISAILQQSSNNSTWSDVKSVNITGNGLFSILMNVEVAADQSYMPLQPQLRVVISTGAGDAVSIAAANSIKFIG